jgi:hypothetical protein
MSHRHIRDLSSNLIDTTGLITAKYGYKCDVLIDGELEVWHEQDLVKMEKEKNGN